MYATEEQIIGCPYCGEEIEIVVDTSILIQEYIEDCQVCCRPITLHVNVIGQDLQVNALHENEY